MVKHRCWRRCFCCHEAKAFVIMSLNDISATIKVLVPYGHAQNLKSPVRLLSKKLDETGKSDSILRFNEHTVSTQSTLSFHLPTLLIDPVSMSLLDEGSISRRQMLDWLTFHIQPKFYHQWLQYQRLLKQRNALLKHPSVHHKLPELFAWDEQLDFMRMLYMSIAWQF